METSHIDLAILNYDANNICLDADRGEASTFIYCFDSIEACNFWQQNGGGGELLQQQKRVVFAIMCIEKSGKGVGA